MSATFWAVTTAPPCMASVCARIVMRKEFLLSNAMLGLHYLDARLLGDLQLVGVHHRGAARGLEPQPLARRVLVLPLEALLQEWLLQECGLEL